MSDPSEAQALLDRAPEAFAPRLDADGLTLVVRGGTDASRSVGLVTAAVVPVAVASAFLVDSGTDLLALLACLGPGLFLGARASSVHTLRLGHEGLVEEHRWWRWSRPRAQVRWSAVRDVRLAKADSDQWDLVVERSDGDELRLTAGGHGLDDVTWLRDLIGAFAAMKPASSEAPSDLAERRRALEALVRARQARERV